MKEKIKSFAVIAAIFESVMNPLFAIQHKQNLTSVPQFNFADVSYNNRLKFIDSYVENQTPLSEMENDCKQLLEGRTLLHFFTEENSIAGVSYLLSLKQIPIDAVNGFGESALHIAAYAGYTNIVQLLLQNGANPNLQTSFGITPLFMALNDDVDNITIINIVKLLLKYGAIINLSNNDNVFPIHIAFERNMVSIIHIFMEYGASVKVSNNSKKTLLDYSIMAKNFEMVELLCNNSANMNARYESSHLALAVDLVLKNKFSLASDGFNRIKIACYLLNKRKNADVVVESAVDSFLLYSAMFNFPNAVTALIQQGAHAEVLHGSDQVSWRFSDLFQYMDDASKFLQFFNSFVPLGENKLSPILEERIKIVCYLINNGASANNIPHQILNTLLLYAAMFDFPNAINSLIINGANIEFVNATRRTALHLAAGLNNVSAVQVLLDNNADINAQDNVGNRPIDLAKQKKALDTYDLLLTYGMPD